MWVVGIALAQACDSMACRQAGLLPRQSADISCTWLTADTLCIGAAAPSGAAAHAGAYHTAFLHFFVVAHGLTLASSYTAVLCAVAVFSCFQQLQGQPQTILGLTGINLH